MTPPTTYRIADKAPEFPCWLWHQGNRLMRPGWYDSRTMIRSWLPAPDHTHWCHSSERPTHDPTAPETPATSAAKGGDIPRTPTDSEMLDWLEKFLRIGGTCLSCDPTGEVNDTDFVHGPGNSIECYSGHYSVGYQVETEHRGCYRWEEIGGKMNRLRAAIAAAMMKGVRG